MDENNNLEIVMGEEAAVVTPVPTEAKKVNQYLAIGSGIIIGAGALYLAYKFLIKPAIAKAKALVDLEGDGRVFLSRLPEETLNAH